MPAPKPPAYHALGIVSAMLKVYASLVVIVAAITALVNKRGINMGTLSKSLSDRKEKGQHLVQMFGQDGNTVQIFEYRLEQILTEQRRTNQLLEWLGQRLTSPTTPTP